MDAFRLRKNNSILIWDYYKMKLLNETMFHCSKPNRRRKMYGLHFLWS